jgi:hypothetical protein
VPTDPYLKALDKEEESNQITKSTRRSSKHQKVHSKKQKTSDAESDIVEEYNPQISQSTSTRKTFSVELNHQLLSPEVGVAANISLHNKERVSKNVEEPVISMVIK